MVGTAGGTVSISGRENVSKWESIVIWFSLALIATVVRDCGGTVLVEKSLSEM